jgi:hypothetical protein
MVVVETQIKIAGNARRSTHLDMHLAEGDNFREKMLQRNATRRGYCDQTRPLV